MAEENTAPQIVVEGGQIVEVTPAPTTPEPTQSAPHFNPVEEHARALGWRPKEEFQGNPDEWRTAREFVERGEFIGKLRSQDHHIKRLEEGIKHIASQNQRAYANGYDQAIRELKVQRRQAIADGDAELADQLEQRIEDTKEEKIKAVQAAGAPVKAVQPPDPEHMEWLQFNPWYENKRMAAWADTAAKDYINERRGQATPNEVRKYIHDLVRAEFPEKFVGGQKNQPTAPNPDGEGRSSNRGSNQSSNQRFSKIESGMSEDEVRIMKTIMRSAGMTKEEYLKTYSEQR